MSNNREYSGSHLNHGYVYNTLGCYQGRNGAHLAPVRLHQFLPEDVNAPFHAMVPMGGNAVPQYGASLGNNSLNRGNVPTYRSYYTVSDAYGTPGHGCSQPHTIRMCGGCNGR